jgi:hypothetical protein
LGILPSLSALGGAGVELGVNIGLADLAEEIVKGGRLRGGWLQDESAPGQAKVDGGVVLEADLLGEALGNSYGEAVSPLLNTGAHRALRGWYLQ